MRWLRDGRREAPGLLRSQYPEWRRAGLRRLVHPVRVHRRYVIDDPFARLAVSVLVIRGRDDVLSSANWGRRLAGQAADGDYVELADAHTFPWDIRPRSRSRSGRSPTGCRDDECLRTQFHGGPGRRCNFHAAVDWRV